MDFLRALGGANIIPQIGQAIQGVNQIDQMKTHELQRQQLGQQVQMQGVAMRKAQEEEARLKAPQSEAALDAMFPEVDDEFRRGAKERMRAMGVINPDGTWTMEGLEKFKAAAQGNRELALGLVDDAITGKNSKLISNTQKLAKLMADPNANPEEVRKLEEDNKGLAASVSSMLAHKNKLNPAFALEEMKEKARLAQMESSKAEDYKRALEIAKINAASRENAAQIRIEAPRADKLVPVMENGKTVYKPQSEAAGMEVPPRPGGATATADYSDASMENLYQEYRIDKKAISQLPARDVQGRAKFREYVARRMKEDGDTPGSLAELGAARKSYEIALNDQQKRRSQIAAWEETAQKNLTVAEKALDKMGQLGSPILNKWIMAGRKSVAGDPEVSAYHAAIIAARTEVAKILSGAMGNAALTDAARKEVEELLPTASTPEQFRAIIERLRQDMKNRMDSLNEEISATRGKIAGLSDKASSSGGGKPTASDPLGLL